MPIKITKIDDLTDESLKSVAANDVVSLFNEELKKANEQWLAKVQEKETLAKDLETKSASAAAELESAKTELKNTQAQLKLLTEQIAQLQQSEAQRVATEKYNQRLAAIDTEFDVTPEQRKVVAKSIQGMSDEQFKTYFEEDITVLFKKKSAAATVTQPEIEKSDASAQTESAIEAGLKNGEQTPTPPNTQTTEAKSFKERFAKHFALNDGIEIVQGKKRIVLE